MNAQPSLFEDEDNAAIELAALVLEWQHGFGKARVEGTLAHWTSLDPRKATK